MSNALSNPHGVLLPVQSHAPSSRLRRYDPTDCPGGLTSHRAPLESHSPHGGQNHHIDPSLLRRAKARGVSVEPCPGEGFCVHALPSPRCLFKLPQMPAVPLTAPAPGNGWCPSFQAICFLQWESAKACDLCPFVCRPSILLASSQRVFYFFLSSSLSPQEGTS